MIGSVTTYATSDFYTAAYLLAGGSARLADVVWSGRRAEFVFQSSGERSFTELLGGFRDGSAKVSAKKFVDAIAALKRELFSAPGA